jgi:hypothetical protein
LDTAKSTKTSVIGKVPIVATSLAIVDLRAIGSLSKST